MSNKSVKDLLAMMAEKNNHNQNASEPSEQQLVDLLNLPDKGPYHFVNLLKFKEKADYPSDHPLAEKDLSGERAYNIYGMAALEHVTKRGGRLITSNNVVTTVIGESNNWDKVATMEYQTVNAFIDMLCDPDYQSELLHRDAGLLDTQLFVTKPQIARPVGRFKALLVKALRKKR